MDQVIYAYRGRSARSALSAVLASLALTFARWQDWTLVSIAAGFVLIAALAELLFDPRGSLSLEDGRIAWHVDGRLAPILGRREGSIPLRAIGAVEQRVTPRGVRSTVIRLRSGETFRLPPRITPPAGGLDEVAEAAGLALTTLRRWI